MTCFDIRLPIIERNTSFRSLLSRYSPWNWLTTGIFVDADAGNPQLLALHICGACSTKRIENSVIRRQAKPRNVFTNKMRRIGKNKPVPIMSGAVSFRHSVQSSVCQLWEGQQGDETAIRMMLSVYESNERPPQKQAAALPRTATTSAIVIRQLLSFPHEQHISYIDNP